MLSVSESKILCFVFGSSHVSLKVCKAKCVPRDPATMHPSLVKGPMSLPYWMLWYLMFCHPCRYGIVLLPVLGGHVIVCRLEHNGYRLYAYLRI